MAQRMTTSQHHMTTSSTGGSSQTQVVRHSYQVQQQQQQQQTQQTFQQYGGTQQQPVRMQYQVQQTQGTTTQGFPAGTQMPGQTMKTETVKQSTTVRTQQFGGVRTPFQAAQNQSFGQPQQNQPGAPGSAGSFHGGHGPRGPQNQFQQPSQGQFQQPGQGQFQQQKPEQFQQPNQGQFQQPNQGQFSHPNQGRFQQPPRGPFRPAGPQSPIPQQAQQALNRPNVHSPQPQGQVEPPQTASPTPQGHYVPKRVVPKWPPQAATQDQTREQFDVHPQGPVDWPPANQQQNIPQQQAAPGRLGQPQGQRQQNPTQIPGKGQNQPGSTAAGNMSGGISPQTLGPSSKQPPFQQQKGPQPHIQQKSQQPPPLQKGSQASPQQKSPQPQNQGQPSPQPRKQPNSPFQKAPDSGQSQPGTKLAGAHGAGGMQGLKSAPAQPQPSAGSQSNTAPMENHSEVDPKFLYNYTVGKLGDDAYGNWDGHSYDPTLPLIKPKGDGNLAKEWPPKNAGGPNMTMTYPSAFKLRDEAPIDHQTLPLTSVPSQPAFKITQPMRKSGDEVWPPKGAFKDVPTTEVRDFIRPEKHNRNYDEFFATNSLPNNYPGYKAPPGTQHVGEMEEAHPL